MARWSSGQDAALSRLKQGFDSPTGQCIAAKLIFTKCAFAFGKLSTAKGYTTSIALMFVTDDYVVW